MARQGSRPGWLREPDPLQNPVGSRLAILGAVALVIGGAAAALTGGGQQAVGPPAGAVHASTPASVAAPTVAPCRPSRSPPRTTPRSWRPGTTAARGYGFGWPRTWPPSEVTSPRRTAPP
ncbi:hypothetical protein [Candidatus Frankia alpina]|uniref:hypothetical protein n=1 Tax=Candidatus Frankia alpina TaxID=2699483 RepID=UPI001F339C6C|nr:hypothetical protein [Candidatus Frankia alpina]